jgi:hypothetical protein
MLSNLSISTLLKSLIATLVTVVMVIFVPLVRGIHGAASKRSAGYPLSPKRRPIYLPRFIISGWTAHRRSVI